MESCDRVCVEGLEVEAEVGVHLAERGIKQRLLVDLVMETDIGQAAASDQLAHAVDYDRASEIARSVIREKHHALIETVAERIADRLLVELAARVGRVFVRVAKPGAVPDAKTVAVEIWRSWKR